MKDYSSNAGIEVKYTWEEGVSGSKWGKQLQWFLSVPVFGTEYWSGGCKTKTSKPKKGKRMGSNEKAVSCRLSQPLLFSKVCIMKILMRLKAFCKHKLNVGVWR